MNELKPYDSKPYYALALDPIHVGTGGYRLGEVDLTIVREPGTNLPKVPGSSLAGAARAYTAMAIDAQEQRPAAEARYRRQEYEIDEKGRRIKWVSCAGKGGEDGSEHCGQMDCPVCVTYGFTIGPQNRSFHGLAQFHDAHLLFFPVHSMVGPVWVTSPAALKDAGYELPPQQQVVDEQLRTASSEIVTRPSPEGRRWGLNLGWLFLDVAGDDFDAAEVWQRLALPPGLEAIQRQLVLVSDKLFELVVNSNLEVRTSVSIDPATGAAEPGGLFTYEALPRGTLLRFSLVYHNPRHYVFPELDEKKEIKPRPFPEEQDIHWLQDNVAAGLRLMQYLGVGGMNTRGFGRLRVVGLPAAEAKGGE